jgi:ferritin
MIRPNLAEAISRQVNAELYSAYLYLSMSAWADRKGLKGVSSWLYVQYQEESAHGLHLYKFLLDRGATPEYWPIDKPESEWDSPLALFEQVARHEAHVTALLNDIASLAMQEKDHASYQFVMWYVNEQVEEESNAETIIQRLELIGSNSGQLLTLDAELGARTFVNPFPLTGAIPTVA